jgi:RNA polymerase-interacting CarD/CdnL/TRCF family regulator
MMNDMPEGADPRIWAVHVARLMSVTTADEKAKAIFLRDQYIEEVARDKPLAEAAAVERGNKAMLLDSSRRETDRREALKRDDPSAYAELVFNEEQAKAQERELYAQEKAALLDLVKEGRLP